MSEALALPQPGAVGEDGAQNAPPLVLLSAPDAIERLLALARTQLGMEVAMISEFAQDRQVVRMVAGDPEAFGLHIGGSAPLFGTYCGGMAKGQLPEVIRDARADVPARDLEVTWEADIGSYIGVPIRFSDGRIRGSLCCLSHSANPSLRERDAEFMTMVAGLIGQQLETEWTARTRRLETVERIRGVLERGGLGVVFRPILDLRSLAIVGYEALTRFQDGRSPERWLAEAIEIGLGPDLERATKQVELAHLEGLPDHAYLWVNLSTSAIGSSRVRDMLAAVPGDRIILGLSPTKPKPEPDPGLMQTVSNLRASGLRVAIDRVGGDPTALAGICRFRPDVLRLDANAVRATESDLSKRDMISFLVRLGSEVGAVIVAEGIETRRTLDVLRDRGVAWGQGYALAPPLTLHDLAHEGPERVG